MNLPKRILYGLKKLRIETIDFRVFMRLLIGVSNAEEYKYLFSFYGERDQRFGIFNV